MFTSSSAIMGIVFVIVTLFLGMQFPNGDVPCFPYLDKNLDPKWVWCPSNQAESDKDSPDALPDNFGKAKLDDVNVPFLIPGETPNEENSKETSGE